MLPAGLRYKKISKLLQTNTWANIFYAWLIDNCHVNVDENQSDF